MQRLPGIVNFLRSITDKLRSHAAAKVEVMPSVDLPWQLSLYFHFSTHPDSFPIFALNPEQARKDEPVR